MEKSLDILDGVSVTPLKRIYHPKGDVYHALKCSDQSFSKFGEAYFTAINHKDLKGWKRHADMLMNLVVPIGEVGFHFFNQEQGKGAFVKAGVTNYCRLTVEPGIWMAFEGLSEELNLVLNIASMAHDPTEATNVPMDTFPYNLVD